MAFSLVIHGHFYQPPRENPWTDTIEREPSAAPFHDWNARIHSECYRANAFARIHDRAGRIQTIVNNYGRLSYNFGPTLARWIERNDTRTHAALLAGDREQRRRLGAGGAVAQAYAHPIVPLCSPQDRRTQLLWGLADFRRRFGHAAEGLWLPETAANGATLASLIDLGVKYTILAPEQVAAVRAPGEEWTSVDRDTVDTGRAYRWMHPDGSGRFLTVAIFDGPLSRGIAFGDATRDAATFIAMARASAERSRVSEPPLVLCASDGELFGHHKKFADLNLAFTSFVEGPRLGIEPTNLGAYLRAHPANWEMALGEGPDGKGTAWSCAHGVGRWWRDCGCSMKAPEQGWNQRWRTPLRAALDQLQLAAAEFYEDAAADFLLDPWGARDAYGEVVDASRAEGDALLAEFGTPRLLAGGAQARDRLRLLMEIQRATLLMYASCGWYFDDIAGLETSLILRFAAHAADLMNAAGGIAPVDAMLDILTEARSNERPGETGADVFRRGAADRVTPARAVATVALSLTTDDKTDNNKTDNKKIDTESAVAPLQMMPGHEVRILSRTAAGDAHRFEVAGRARVSVQRTGVAQTVNFAVSWDDHRGFHLSVDGDVVPVASLVRESRHRVFPLVLPRLIDASKSAPVVAGRLALELGKDVLGTEDGPGDGALRRGCAQILLNLLAVEGHVPAGAGEAARELFEFAGTALALGTFERTLAEELLAQRLAKTQSGGAGVWARLAEKLGFVSPTASAEVETAAAPPNGVTSAMDRVV